jgi:microcystin-dependent protein
MSARNSYNVAPIPGDNNGGSGGGGGGGGGGNVGAGIPVGSVLPFASATIPDKFLLCNGTEYRQDLYEDLYETIGYTYGTAPATTTFAVSGGYSTSSTTIITFTETTAVNPFIKVGTYLKLSGFTAISGPNVNGVIVVVTSCPAIGTNTGGNYQCTIPIPLPATGNGSAGTLNRFSIATPDLRLAGPVGAQAGTINLGTSGGSATTTLTADNLPQHRHGYNLAAGTGYASADGSNGNRASQTQNYTNGDQTYLNGSNTATTNSAFSIRNPYVSFNFIIKAET